MVQSGEARALDTRHAAERGGAQQTREPSMEEILASIKRIIEDTDSVKRPSNPSDASDSALEVDLPDVANDAAHEAQGGEVMAFRDEFRADPEPAAVENTHDPEPAAPVAEPSPAFAPSTPPRQVADPVAEASAQRSAIISDMTGRQVAAAFGELNEAFAASRKRSFDEVAEDMMRPMLQDWFDNNLPLLVERLVREEIERVARGGVR